MPPTLLRCLAPFGAIRTGLLFAVDGPRSAPRRAVVNGLLARFVDVSEFDKHNRFDGCAATLADCERDGSGAHIVLQIGNRVEIDITERIVKGFDFASQALGHLRRRTTSRPTLTRETFRTLSLRYGMRASGNSIP